MKKTLWAASICAGLLLAASAPAWAHHAFQAEFDQRKPVKLEGKVTDMEWINPHAWIHIDVKNPDGTVAKWEIEGSSPNALIRRGFSKQSLKPGTEIIVRGYQSKDKLCAPDCKANGRDVTFPDGRKLFMGSSGTGAPRDGSDPTEKQ